MKPQACLTIGGSDSCGGAGIQADLAVFKAANWHGCSVITALTAQNPHQISHIEAVSLKHLEAEMRAIFEYYDVIAIKTGMLFDGDRIELIADLLQELHAGKVLIVDPVLVSSSGTRLLAEGAVAILKDKLFPRATLITPNLQEAKVLLARKPGDMLEDVAALVLRFQCAVLLKGGHGEGNELMDVFCDNNGAIEIFKHAKKPWGLDASHGTGCRLAAMITATIAQGSTLNRAVGLAVQQLQDEITQA